MNEQSIDEEQLPVSESGRSPGESLAHQPTRELQKPDFEPATAEIPMEPMEPYLATGNAIHPDDADDEWPQEQTRRGLRLPILTAIIVGLAILAAGFWGGAAVEKHHVSTASSSASSALSSLANRFAAARGSGSGGFSGSGSGGFAGAGAGSATAGIVTAVQGNTLYVTDSSGKLVKVQVGPSATVTRTAKTSLAGLQTGDTVVVQGTSGPSGTVTATSVRATAAGVSTGGSFPGGGFFGGGTGTGSGGG